MTDSHSTAKDIDAIDIELHQLRVHQGNGAERLVDLVVLDVRGLQACVSQRPRNRIRGSCAIQTNTNKQYK